jgi:DNA-binding NarL/FixJ family response regulator
VESLVNHKPFFVGRLSEELLKSYLTTRVHRDRSALTPRERLVIHLVSEGHTNKEIGTILNLSAKTIETHRATAMHKVNLTSTAAIVRYAVRNKIVEP